MRALGAWVARAGPSEAEGEGAAMSGGPETIDTWEDERQAGENAAAIASAARTTSVFEAAAFGLSRGHGIFEC